MRLFRLFHIVSVVIRHGLDEFLPSGFVKSALGIVFFWRSFTESRGLRLKRALESLGPIFVKFGQLLSTRPDLIPADIAHELSALQDAVAPFGEADVRALVDRVYREAGKGGMAEVFSAFDVTPVASASVAQVHFATLASGKLAGREVAVKLVRPGIEKVIGHDVALLYVAADLIEALFPDGKRLRPREVIAEFDKTVHDELDMVREAANGAALKRHFADGTLLYVPEVYFDYTLREVLVMERMDFIPVNDTAALQANGIDLARLAADGVKIFFTQVFRDGFFHADMHPGNIFVLKNGVYSGVDFGIMGTLTDADKNYLARNFAAFFERDYKGVAIAHIEAGWVPKDTRVDEFEAAIRSVCEPIFDKPLDEIYFGAILFRLFEVSRRFKMQIQPQLVLLQKTLLQIEGLGRQLYPKLDLRPVAQPILKRWMDEQVGVRGVLRQLRHEAPQWASIVPQLPRLLHRAIEQNPAERLKGIEEAIARVEAVQRVQTAVLLVVALLAAGVVGLYIYLLFVY
ncbi:MAG TPA: ubiquinone biosynthesis regulatory protein kinase UbiB [Usitatibacteraceae bacterium]|nr:ubiquinone biosynthesis regulatory protein kinase UbiB [Usitatibacteraceae bacterium]